MSEAGDAIGTLATGALLAGAVDGAQDTHGDHAAGRCVNCGTARIGPFCHGCGQNGHIHKNLSALVHDIAHGVFHIEGKLWRTLPLLAWHPGRLTRRYIDGERAKFVSPMALFLFSVFLMFAVASGLSGHHAAAGNKADGVRFASDAAAKLGAAENKLAKLQAERGKMPDASAQSRIDQQIVEAKDEVRALGIAAGASAIVGSSSTKQKKVVHLDTGWSAIDSRVAQWSANPELTLYKLKTYGYKYSWALVPISMPFVWLLFAFRRNVGLYDHAIFSIYSLSFMSLGVVALTLLSWLGVESAVIAIAVMLIPPVHIYRQLKGAYGLGWFGAGWRTVALLFIATITSSVFIAFLFWMGSD